MPGVYLMKDRDGKVLYVGKAKNLRARVSSYFLGRDERHNVPYLIARVRNIDTLVTENERQAIILENDLIKKYKPHYNIRLKDDRAHLTVRIDMAQEWPRLELVRQIENDGARYIGPFAFTYELRALLEIVKRTVPLRTCSDRVLMNRVRPCLEYQIKRCAAPCCLPVDKAQYLEWVGQAAAILEGKNEEVLETLRADMERASADLRFEDAAAIRDRIAVLEKIAAERPAVLFGEGARDAFGIYRDGQNLELSVLMVRKGRLFEADTFSFTDIEFDPSEILPSLLSQYYGDRREPPEEVLLPIELEDKTAREELYAQKLNRKVEFIFPKKGPKARLLALAQQNARENYQARFGLGSEDRALRALASELELAETPRLIECADISHFQGSATVGSVDLTAALTRSVTSSMLRRTFSSRSRHLISSSGVRA